jgi:hypothetical protein
MWICVREGLIVGDFTPLLSVSATPKTRAQSFTAREQRAQEASARSVKILG